jgi:rod shape determining protein RodA
MLNTFSNQTRLSSKNFILLCFAALNILSLICIFSALNQGGILERGQIFHRQIMWITVSWVALWIVSHINYRLYYDAAYIFFGFNILLLIAVDAMGATAMGAQRWLSFGGLNFQPSELCKVATIFLMARLFSRPDAQGFFKGVLHPLVLVAIASLLIFKQPDLGTALVVFFLFFAMGMASKLKKRYFVLLIAAGMMVFPFAWHTLKDYQKKRLIVFVNPNTDPLGAGYNIIQSKIAIGSGQLFGKGFLSGTQNQFNFMPERHTDFIFTVLAEEWGFLGGLLLLTIYWILLNKALDIATFAKDEFGRLITIGITLLFFIHVFVNMGMTLGILPVVGIPLIFMSYGGSNLLINSMLIGILMNIHRQSRGF